jgi:hypothetical protein
VLASALTWWVCPLLRIDPLTGLFGPALALLAATCAPVLDPSVLRFRTLTILDLVMVVEVDPGGSGNRCSPTQADAAESDPAAAR